MKQKTNTRFLPKGLTILYEDRDILVVDKPAGLLTIATDSEKSKTAYASLMDYVKKGSDRSKNRIFIVHRLDRDTSGVLVFAKTEVAKQTLQENWDNTKKVYIAVTHGIWKLKQSSIQSYLTESKAHRVYSVDDPKLGKFSETKYKVLKESNLYSLLEIDLITGRKNQIRVHFAEKGHPIVGDTKYGNESKSFPRMALHSFSITLTHPFQKKPLTFITNIPNFITGLVGGYERKQDET
ncbi:RNA pseudouridine synthase [Leptospira levettii]|uniref:RNA pseudouridine synthase n=2 Tax=Leptospira levettii TaxID=2023178 RepID=A0ABY2MQF1_9LEPT|nr:RNA pseudouridine synthase [Leptospira levettii]PKA27919.1 RNA pseudouridine synthase [Leptospira sp. mixed culture ATI2-C-A1]PJZ38519.1 RNA pseudouridine synthase [Leptospira levettii]PJZ90251.1 RNA pseudouridine synthase [Leptospira levettii]PKA01853.1 RNA pseudouridine synthase [Leptospira levettii]TGK99098.1 RNA pseudouridine synthase [Leptospira levettii]